MGKRATKQVATNVTKMYRKARRKISRHFEKNLGRIMGRTRSEQMANKARFEPSYLDRVNEPSAVARRVSRELKKLAMVQKVAMRKVGKMLPPTAIAALRKFL
jgi:hypothetical protein